MLEHQVLGPFGHMATPMRFSHDTLAPFRAPGMGEHSFEVARRICGLAQDEVERLDGEGVFH
jgi:crotonobetainyl-CoA:carnitine CoA-transferase CaiB-like acyl-CoA transferase